VASHQELGKAFGDAFARIASFGGMAEFLVLFRSPKALSSFVFAAKRGNRDETHDRAVTLSIILD
jgi:hypothetical protein